MNSFRKYLATGAVAAVLGVGALAATSTAVEARTVCNRYGDCWHESTRYDYPARLGVRFYGDNWRHNNWHDHDRYDRWRWRENHDGRGYWRNGVWIRF